MPSSAPGTWFTAQHPPPIRTLQRLHGMRRLGCLPQILHRPLFPRERALATGCPFCGDPSVTAAGVCSGPAPESAPISGCSCRWSTSSRPSGNCRFVASEADVWMNLTIFARLLFPYVFGESSWEWRLQASREDFCHVPVDQGLLGMGRWVARVSPLLRDR